MRHWLTFASFIAIALSFVTLIGPVWAGSEEIYGPVNLLKTMPTPFGSPTPSQQDADELSPVSLSGSRFKSLSSRLLAARLYLPGRMVLGQPAEFIIKGKPGQWVALAMADKNSGAKPIYGKDIALGADRKLVSLGQIGEGGVVSLVVETPIQGDLIGQQLYFEAALWTRPDFSDVELAAPVPSEATATANERNNGVLVSAESEKKKGVRIVPDGMVPFTLQQRSGSIDSGRP